MRGSFFLILCSFLFACSILLGDLYEDTRKPLIVERRLNRSSFTTIGLKNNYIKSSVITPKDGIGLVAARMNKREADFSLPYVWGAGIDDFRPGFDCSGFLHGLLYYQDGWSGRRFNTRALYFKLLRNQNYIKVFDAFDREPFDPSSLMVNDIILWPSGVLDGKHLTGRIMGHVGVVSSLDRGGALVTHYVDSDRYNPIDYLGSPGPGINTIDAYRFVSFKQRGRLVIFRRKPFSGSTSRLNGQN